MKVDVLIPVIQFFLMVLVGLWVLIGLEVLSRRIRKKRFQLIESLFAEICSSYLYPLPGEERDLVKIQRAFRKAGVRESRPENVQYLINLMLRTQRTLLGENYKKLELLFAQIPPFRASVTKLKSRKWYIKARGIREIYEMDQEQYLPEIRREINNMNVFVRREAQIAMVVFLGWDSLRFLPYLQREMTLWQQIKIVEKLHDLYPVPNLIHLRKVYAAEEPFAQELVMRIIRKFQLETEIQYILRFIDHDNFDRRETAIYCLSSFQLQTEEMALVQEKFSKVPNVEQRLQLLRYISRAAVQPDLKFLHNILKKEDDVLKLGAAEILWNNGYEALVQDYYYGQYVEESLEKDSA